MYRYINENYFLDNNDHPGHPFEEAPRQSTNSSNKDKLELATGNVSARDKVILAPSTDHELNIEVTNVNRKETEGRIKISWWCFR